MGKKILLKINREFDKWIFFFWQAISHLRIDNRRYGPFWWGGTILGTILSLLRSNAGIIYLSKLVSGLFIDIKHVKITWSETIRVYSKYEN